MGSHSYRDLTELDTQRIIAEELKLIDPVRSAQLDVRLVEVRKMLYALSAKLKSTSKLKTEN